MKSPTASAVAAQLIRHGQGTKIRLRAGIDGAPATPTLVFDRIEGDAAILLDESTCVGLSIDLATLAHRGERRVTYAGLGAAMGLILLGGGGCSLGKLLDWGGGSGMTIPQLVAMIGGGAGLVIGAVVGWAFDRWEPLLLSG